MNSIVKFLIVLLALVFQNCQLPLDNASTELEVSEALNNSSFVLSCGSGCALTYNTSEINQNEEWVTIKFKVETYVNEELADDHFETYQFKTDSNKVILGESGSELPEDIHLRLYNELLKVFDYLK